MNRQPVEQPAFFDEPELNPETQPHTLHRKDSPGTSIEAAHQVAVTEKEQLVLGAVKAGGARGATTKEIRAKHPDLPYSSITARPAALEEKGLIFYRDEKRDGCRVMFHHSLIPADKHCLKCGNFLPKWNGYLCPTCHGYHVVNT